MSGRAVRALNGDIVTDSESDEPSKFVGLHDVFITTGLSLVKKWTKTIKCRAQRLKANAVAEYDVLSHQCSQDVWEILVDCLNIAQEIEAFVEDRELEQHMETHWSTDIWW